MDFASKLLLTPAKGVRVDAAGNTVIDDPAIRRFAEQTARMHAEQLSKAKEGSNG